MIKLLLFTFAIAFFPLRLFAQWHQLPGPSAGSVNDFCEIAGSNGGEIYAATPNGVYRTMDHAKTWQLMGLNGQATKKIIQYATPAAEILLAIIYENSESAWHLCRSDDSGHTWDTVFAETSASLFDILQDGNDVVFAIAGTEGDSAAGIYRSADIGHTWTHQALAPTSSGILSAIAIGGSSIFCIAGFESGNYDTIWTMPDHGSVWQSTSYPAWHHPQSIKFFGNDLFVGAYGRMDISTDNGISWLKPPNNGLDTAQNVSGDTIPDILSTFAVNGLTIVAAGRYGVYRSTDGASSWQLIVGVSGYPGIFNTQAIDFLDNKFFSAGDVGIVTSSDGISWAYNSEGIVGGTMEIATYGSTLFATTFRGVFRSTDRGQHWIDPSSARDLVDSEAYLLQSVGGSIFAMGSKGLWRWQDSEWNLLSDESVLSITADSAALFAAAGSGGIIRSSDGGTTWSLVNTALPLDSASVEVVQAAPGIILAFLARGTIYASSDEGMSWHWWSTLSGNPISAAIVLQSVYVATGNHLFTSNDEGKNWSDVGLMAEYVWPFRTYAVVAASDGIYLIDGSQIKFLNDSVSPWYFNAFTTDDSFMYVATHLGDIYAAPLTSLPLAVTPSPSAPLPLRLSIFPNPSTGHATIDFTLPERENISLKLFDERGVTVATYFAGMAGPGEVQVPIDASELSGGSYIAILSTREGTGVARVAILPR